MTKETKAKAAQKGAPFAGVAIVTYIGALVHFLNTADGFWQIIFAFFKALVWPGFLVNKVFDLLRI